MNRVSRFLKFANCLLLTGGILSGSAIAEEVASLLRPKDRSLV